MAAACSPSYSVYHPQQGLNSSSSRSLVNAARVLSPRNGVRTTVVISKPKASVQALNPTDSLAEGNVDDLLKDIDGRVIVIALGSTFRFPTMLELQWNSYFSGGISCGARDLFIEYLIGKYLKKERSGNLAYKDLITISKIILRLSPKDVLTVYKSLSSEDKKELERAYSALYYPCIRILLTPLNSYEKVVLPASLIGKISQTRELGKVGKHVPAPPRSAGAGGGEDNSSQIPTQLTNHSLDANGVGSSSLDAMSTDFDSDPIKQSAAPTEHMENRFLGIGGVTGRELKNPHIMLSMMKPSVTVSLGEFSSKTRKARGCSPAWVDRLSLEVPRLEEERNCALLIFNINSKGWLSNVNVGSASVPLKNLLKGGGEMTLPVVRLSGRFQGELSFSYSFSAVASASAPAAAATVSSGGTLLSGFLQRAGAIFAGNELQDLVSG